MSSRTRSSTSTSSSTAAGTTSPRPAAAGVYRHTLEGKALENRRIKGSTRSEYEAKATILLRGLKAVKPDAIGKTGNRNYVDFKQLSFDDISEAMLRDRNPNGKRKSASVYKKHASALNYIAVEQKELVPESMKSRIKGFISGLTKQDAELRKKGLLRSYAKDIMPERVHWGLMEEALLEGSKSSLFFNAFGQCAFMLMSRAESIDSLAYRACRVKNDALVFRFNQTKPDQEGKRTDDKHVYVGPHYIYFFIINPSAVAAPSPHTSPR